MGPTVFALDPGILASLDLWAKITIGGGLFLILTSGYYELWVWGRQLKECNERWLKRDAEWVERMRVREEELKAEIREWKDSDRRKDELLSRTLALQEQRLRDELQRRDNPTRNSQ